MDMQVRTKTNLDGAKELVAPINGREAVYFLSFDKKNRENHVLKLDSAQKKIEMKV